ncbi:hypothetical protein N5T78_06985 [Aliarcobacter cryaerophilus]|uniref:glycosyltransferase family 2 protein n=1 Tax=Aliarcobacter cryaerophilus TaxID=28198 RepID=UPI0021B6D67B|nr:hypothetical protein [Aliarcobacter cryaerophilus]MCT7466317.1 hypothetical protein [Aliarcobacter cryaerophilus]
MKKINFCIVLYNKKIFESNTITSLDNYFRNNKVLGDIVVFNNGPEEVELYDADYFICNQVLVNASLSKIYNKFIDEYLSDYYVFLDDDTFLTDTFLNELKNIDSDIFLPQISCEGEIHYPVIKNQSMQTITSGLTLSSKIIQDLKSYHQKVFDERFDLYGIDTAFCNLINKMKLNYEISNSIIEHDLSHISSGNNDFREIEVLLSNSASLFPYFSFRLLLSVGYGNLKMIKKLKFNVLLSSFFSIILQRTIRTWRF